MLFRPLYDYIHLSVSCCFVPCRTIYISVYHVVSSLVGLYTSQCIMLFRPLQDYVLGTSQCIMLFRPLQDYIQCIMLFRPLQDYIHLSVSCCFVPCRTIYISVYHVVSSLVGLCTWHISVYHVVSSLVGLYTVYHVVSSLVGLYTSQCIMLFRLLQDYIHLSVSCCFVPCRTIYSVSCCFVPCRTIYISVYNVVSSLVGLYTSQCIMLFRPLQDYIQCIMLFRPLQDYIHLSVSCCFVPCRTIYISVYNVVSSLVGLYTSQCIMLFRPLYDYIQCIMLFRLLQDYIHLSVSCCFVPCRTIYISVYHVVSSLVGLYTSQCIMLFRPLQDYIHLSVSCCFVPCRTIYISVYHVVSSLVGLYTSQCIMLFRPLQDYIHLSVSCCFVPCRTIYISVYNVVSSLVGLYTSQCIMFVSSLVGLYTSRTSLSSFNVKHSSDLTPYRTQFLECSIIKQLINNHNHLIKKIPYTFIFN